jgi:hypothetical protein
VEIAAIDAYLRNCRRMLSGAKGCAKMSRSPRLLFSVFAVALVVAGSPGQASARPDTRAMTCEAARAFIRSNGAVVMSTGQYTYDRIVAGYGWCGPGEETELKVVPTLDNPKCRIGYICRDRIDDDKPFWWRLR